LYLGTWFGKGKNIYSWIHIEDLIDSIIFLLENNKKGVFNLVAPNPVTSKAFTLELSKILNKKILIPPIPISFIKTITGSMSELLLFSQYVSCEKLKSEGYNFKFNNLTEALKDLIK
jgi:NAD dependent epimerase/dehydratase family enzyme